MIFFLSLLSFSLSLSFFFSFFFYSLFISLILFLFVSLLLLLFYRSSLSRKFVSFYILLTYLLLIMADFEGAEPIEVEDAPLKVPSTTTVADGPSEIDELVDEEALSDEEGVDEGKESYDEKRFTVEALEKRVSGMNCQQRDWRASRFFSHRFLELRSSCRFFVM
jgi:hypothetical protein